MNDNSRQSVGGQSGQQPDLVYGGPADIAGGAKDVSLAIFADRPALRASMRDDVAAAGVRTNRIGSLADLLHADARSLADVVLVDCPVVEPGDLAALVCLDTQAAKRGTRLIVSTSVSGLDDVFACMDQSAPQILVDPNRAERVVALGQVLAGFPAARLRELSDDDRLMILRLTEQVGQIAGRIERLAPTLGSGVPLPRGNGEGGIVATGSALRPGEVQGGVRPAEPDLPDARIVRRIIRQRQLRGRFMDAELFADPAWDMLLDLTASRVERSRVSVTSLCIAAAVPPTTALRWIGQMVEAGIFVRTCDDQDRRRAFIELSDSSAGAIARYFDEIGVSTATAL